MLLSVELVVAAFEGIERCMSAALHNASGLHHQDLVGLAHGGKTMRNYKRGAAFHQVLEALLNEGFRFGVEAGGGFIEDQNFRIGENSASNGDPLALPAGKLDSAFTNDGVIFIFEALRKLIHMGDAAGCHDF